MANMDYCRFENTFNDLRECIKALENREISSTSEKRYAERLINEFLDFCVAESIIEELDDDKKIKEIIDECE